MWVCIAEIPLPSLCYHAASNSSVKCYCASSGFDPVPVNPYYDICKPVCIVCRVRSFLCVHVIKGREDLIEWAQPEAQNSNLLHVSTAASEGGATIMQTKPWTCHWLNNTENNAFLILGLSLLCYRCAYVCSAVLGVHSWAYSYCLHQPNLANSLTVAWLHLINESLHWCSMWQLLSKTVIVKYPSLSVCPQSVFFTTLILNNIEVQIESFIVIIFLRYCVFCVAAHKICTKKALKHATIRLNGFPCFLRPWLFHLLHHLCFNQLFPEFQVSNCIIHAWTANPANRLVKNHCKSTITFHFYTSISCSCNGYTS